MHTFLLKAGLVTFGHQVSLFSIQNDPESLHDAAAKATPIWKLGMNLLIN